MHSKLNCPRRSVVVTKWCCIGCRSRYSVSAAFEYVGDLQNQHHTCPLLENLEAVIECIKPPNIKGVVSALEFVKIALQRIFALPFEKIIASYQVHNNRIIMLNAA